MKTNPMTEESMQRMEATIPELAGNALRKAYLQALTVNGSVIEARNGELVETSSEGHVRFIRAIAKPIPVEPGTRRTRARKA